MTHKKIPDWFLVPAIPEYLIREGRHEDRSTVDLENVQATKFDVDADSSSINIFSDDTEGEIEILTLLRNIHIFG